MGLLLAFALGAVSNVGRGALEPNFRRFLRASHVVPQSPQVTLLLLSQCLKLTPQLAGNGLHLQPC